MPLPNQGPLSCDRFILEILITHVSDMLKLAQKCTSLKGKLGEQVLAL